VPYGLYHFNDYFVDFLKKVEQNRFLYAEKRYFCTLYKRAKIVFEWH